MSEKTFKLDDLIFESEVDADKVLDALKMFAEEYDHVTVADYYEACGMDSSDKDALYGWKFDALTEVEPRKYETTSSWYLNLPSPQPLE